MFDTIKCRSCGAENKKNSKFCSQCGQMVSGQICTKCGQPVRSGAAFCSGCGAKVESSANFSSATYPEEFPDLSKSNVWQRRPNDLAHRFEVSDLNSYFGGFTKKITVMQGTKAIFLQGGKYQGDLPPGTYTADSVIEFLKTLNFYEKTTIILVDDGDVPVDFSIGGLRTRENFDAGVKGKMVVKIDKPILFFDNLMKSRPHLEVIDLLSTIRNELLNVLQSKIKGYSFEDLYGNLELRKELQQDFEFNLTTTLSRLGLQLVHLPYFDYDETYWQDIIQQRGTMSHDLLEKREKMREEANIKLSEYEQAVETKVRKTEVDRAEEMVDKERETLERKRFDEITKMIRERLTDDKMNEFKNAEDLEKYLYSIDTNRVIRTNDMTGLKILFENNRQDKATARKLMLERMYQRHQLDMQGEVIEEGVKGRRVVDDYDLEKRGKVSGQDVKEAEAGIELLRKMKAAKREDATGYQALELEKAQKAADIEAERLRARSAATDEAQISMAEGKAGEQLSEIARMKQAKALSEEQLMALSAKDSAAVAAALKEKYGSDQVKAMYEQRMKDQEAYVQRMQQMEERTMDHMERVHTKSLEEMGQTASTRATAGSSGGTTVVAPGGFGGAPVIVGSGAVPAQPVPAPGPKKILCRKCNAELDPTERFCNTCGEKVQP
ncbi:zinc-ribbon domain-containing protein [Methanoregula sp.]|uniref:zinc-ribbon domain-containing protein n=1 Tax=Methanoregula sp. TaxID=2052170 RepID=UPI003567456B